MANRHSHKKLRAEIRARRVTTGESYQTARQRVLARQTPDPIAADLTPLTRFGVPMTLATLSGGGVQWFAVLGHAPRTATLAVHASPLFAMRLLRPRGVN